MSLRIKNLKIIEVETNNYCCSMVTIFILLLFAIEIFPREESAYALLFLLKTIQKEMY